MVLQLDLKHLFKELLITETGRIQVEGSDVFLSLGDKKETITFSTPVYNGGNYIPHSVRLGMEDRSFHIRDALPVKLKVDEEAFVIHLEHHAQLLELQTSDQFISLIEDFTWLANLWRDFFDEKDNNDRVYVRRS